MPNWREFHSGWFMRLVEVPGYGRVTTGKPGFNGYFSQNNGDFRVRIQINEFGLRNNIPVKMANSRVWIIGDSMAFGWGIERKDIYSAVAERVSQVPTYNVASPGTSVCGYQALYKRMPNSIKPTGVVVGLILENDIHAYDCKAVEKGLSPILESRSNKTADNFSFADFKGLLTKNLALYNFFAISLKRVNVARELLTRIGFINKEHVNQKPVEKPPFGESVEKTADELLRLKMMVGSDVPFAVLIAPTRFEVRDGDPFSRELRLGLIDAISSRGIEVLDPFEKFKKAGFQATHFSYDGHWSPQGHEIAGQLVAQWITRILP